MTAATSTSAPLELRARYIFPVSSPPLVGGAVSILGSKIVGVSAQASRQAVDLGDVAIIPGLVNAHAHLEFSSLAEPLGRSGMEFTAWIRQVIAHRRSAPPQPGALAQGIAECIRAGTTTIGEISTQHRFTDAELPPVELTDFAEVICLDRQRIADVVSATRSKLEASHLTDHYRPGISPHAPYTVHVELLDRLVELAAERSVPLAMHVAESSAEMELLATGGGPFRTLLEELGVWQSGAIAEQARPLDYLERLARAPRSLVIHGNYLDAEEIELLAQHRDRMAVVYCPRTHAFFGHPPHPLPKLLQAGARVALGTDGRSSNPDLSLLAELRFAAGRFAGIAPQELLRLAALDGAAALGIDDRTGSLEVGKDANLACVRVRPGSPADPHEALLTGDEPVVATMFRGQWTWLEPSLAERLTPAERD
ncbi:MAG TPA: amidohydrolase family protein [Pirellulales bacterium]|nr:amidohydrolase family protein [Pirellulales bacterium]